MAVDGLAVLDISGIQNISIASGPIFPTGPRNGELFELTETFGEASPGIYLYSLPFLSWKVLEDVSQTELNTAINSVTVTKTALNLGNVDNTSDASKPISIAQQDALNLKAPLASPTFTGNVTVPTPTASTDAVTKAYVDSTVSGATITFASLNGKPTSLAGYGIADAYTKSELDASFALKAPLTSPTFVGTVTVPSPINNTDAVTKAYVDTAVIAATPSFSALAGKPTTLSGYGISDAYTKAAIDTSLALKAPLASPTFTGTVTVPSPVNATDAVTKAYADGIATGGSITKATVGLGNVDNTSDASKPVSSAQQIALNLKAPLASPTFTGTVTVPTPVNNTDAVTKAYVDSATGAAPTFASLTGKPTTLSGYGITDAYTKTSVDTSLALKAPLASPTFTGTVTVPSPVNSTDAVTKAYVDSTVTAATPTFASLTGKPTTLSGYGITDAAPKASPTFTGTVTVPTPINSTDAVTKAYADAIATGGTITFSSLAGRPTTIAGYGITDGATTTALALKAPSASPTFTGTVTVPTPVNTTDATTKTYVDSKTWAFSAITSVPTTLAGHSITDAYTKTVVDTALGLKANLASPTFTGTVTVPTPVNNTDATTKAYVDSKVGGTTGLPYDLAFSILGVPLNSAIILRFVAVRAFTIAANFTGSVAKCAAAPTATTTLTIKKNGTSIGTVSFAGAATSGTFSTQAASTFASGDILTVENQATADTTWGNAEITLAATTA